MPVFDRYMPVFDRYMPVFTVFTRIYPYSLLYSTPLGSPTRFQKRPYVHVPVGCGTGVVYSAGTGTGYGAVRVWYRVGIPEGLYRCTTQPPRTYTAKHPADSGAGPGDPAGVGVGGQLGAPRTSVHPDHHSSPCRASGPASLSGFPPRAKPPLGPKRRELTSFYRNLDKTAKCHQNMSIRPPIVPVSILSSRIHLLKFSDFHLAAPSLTRN